MVKKDKIVIADIAEREIICADCVARNLTVKPGEKCPVCGSMETRYL